MIRFEPTGRGAEPQVSTTGASATPRPALRQSSAALRISSSRASVLMGASRTFYRHVYRHCPFDLSRPRAGTVPDSEIGTVPAQGRDKCGIVASTLRHLPQ